ncbi:MAG: T9SS C-terminal target domain-containing protein, partial [candidate division KSB1 bacterium]|nr:T9SS C-terminal target domain-containing protein [candidate division KSB1 bacterium]
MQIRKKVLLTLAGLLFAGLAQAQTTVTVTDSDIAPGQKVVWTSDKVYVLDGFVFVDEGAELWIEPGTVIKGKPGQGEQASALIVARGGKIYAMGTPTHPIIFTAEADD